MVLVRDYDPVTGQPTYREQIDRPKASFTTTQRDALRGVQLWTGRIIYNTTTGGLEFYNGSAWAPLDSRPPDTAYAVALQGQVGNPNIGATGTATGRYTLDGPYVDWSVIVIAAGAGQTTGTGPYGVGLPFPVIHSGFEIVGVGWRFDGGAGVFHGLIVDGNGYGAQLCRFIPSDGVAFAWSANSVLSVGGRYRWVA